ncbi:MAG TPA: lipopolysaccharide ABC transporter ATP-binding protein, partial [Blastocatellia bacterium]|nr:lipopolysaccharide ABC transporter ATP-binding protein [Blastocatellia bacterium]
MAAFGLRKSYGRRRVVDDVTLHVEPGEVVGLLGANGAGK